VGAAAAYLRVSTRQQDWALQRREIVRAAAARGDQIAKLLWFEEKASGRSIEREALKKLRAAVRAGKVRRLYVWRVDRLTRSGIRDTFHLVEEFRQHGAELVTVADGFDFSGPAADVVLAVMAWAAQMERNAISERIRAARARVEAEGGRWGRPRNVELDPKTLQRARRLRQTRSLREVAAMLKVPRSTLGDALAGNGHYGRSREKLARASSKP
jgi:DNA invertase Pin-like site-specific DNA recombinase